MSSTLVVATRSEQWGFGICKLMQYKFLLRNEPYFVNYKLQSLIQDVLLITSSTYPLFVQNQAGTQYLNFFRALILYLSINSLV